MAAIAVYRYGGKMPGITVHQGIFFGLYLNGVLLSAYALFAFGINKSDGIFYLIQLAVFPVFVYVLLELNKIHAFKRNQIADIISLLALLAIVIGLVQYVFEIHENGLSLASADAVKSTFAHKNIFSEILLLTLPFSLYRGIIGKRKLQLTIALLTVMMIVLLLSRAVWFAAAVAAMACLAGHIVRAKVEVSALVSFAARFFDSGKPVYCCGLVSEQHCKRSSFY